MQPAPPLDPNVPKAQGSVSWLLVLLAANALLFVVTFLGLGLFNRHSADDFHYLALTQEHGVWQAMLLHYHHWNPRWASTLVVNGFFAHGAQGLTLPMLHLLTVLLGCVSLALLLVGAARRAGVALSACQMIFLPPYLMAGLFYVSFGTGDTWFWLCSVPMYLWGVLAVALGFGLLLRKGGKWWRIPAVAVVFLYVGGSSEPVAISALILLVYLGLIQKDNVGPKMYHVATLACLIGFCIDAMGSGAQVRLDHLPQLPITDKLWIGIKNYGRLVLLRIPEVLPALVAFLLPVAWLGSRSKTMQASSFVKLYRRNRGGFVVADLTALGLSFMLALVMADMGPDRAWLPMSALMLVLGAMLAFQMGTLIETQLRGRLLHLAILAQLLLFAYQTTALIIQLPKAMHYAEAYDTRMLTIRQAAQQGHTEQQLTPLPDAGWLHSAEITADSSHHSNRHLSLHFGGRIHLFVADSLTSGAP